VRGPRHLTEPDDYANPIGRLPTIAARESLAPYEQIMVLTQSRCGFREG
jgi:hypothetical protein